MPIFTPCLTLITSMIVTASYESQRQLKSINQELECANPRLASYSKDLEGEVGDRTEELSSALNDLQTTQINLIQAEKMAALGQMVAGIAHELNNPISYISGNVEHAKAYSEELLVVIDVFRERYQDAETDALLEDLDLEYVRSDFAKLLASIDKGTQRITDIVQSLRTFSRLDEAELKQINLSNDLSSVLLLTKSRIENRPDNLEIDLSTQFDELPAVQCYAAQINQVFLNLLENAIDAIEVSFAENNLSNGKIVVEGKTLETEHIQISITDNGVGIPENLQTKIFDPFFTTKPIGQGTGLGLAIAHSVVVEQHQGSLSCETTPDGKTTFTLVLPITHRFYHTGKAATQ